MTTQTEETLYTVADAAGVIGVHPRTLTRQIHDGKVKAHPLTGRGFALTETVVNDLKAKREARRNRDNRN